MANPAKMKLPWLRVRIVEPESGSQRILFWPKTITYLVLPVLHCGDPRSDAASLVSNREFHVWIDEALVAQGEYTQCF